MMKIPEKTWNQEHYDAAKKIIPDDVKFLGPGSAMAKELEFDLGNAVRPDTISDVAERTASAFEDHDVPVDDVFVKAGYRGACNNALLLVVRFRKE